MYGHGMTEPREPTDPVRPFEQLRETGVLWAINRAVFHPRGYALAFEYDSDGNAIGWSLVGNGSEPWTFADPQREDVCFAAFAALLLETKAANR